MNIRSILRYAFFVFTGFLMLSSCSKSDDQRAFENEAFSTPTGITETNSSGDTIGNVDEADWQVAPMYSGLIQLKSEFSDYPYPNPLGYNQTLTIQLKFNSTDVLNGIEILKFRFPSDSKPQLKYIQGDQISSSVENIPIEGKIIADGPGESARTLYRILIYDGKQNLISYGDIEIQ